MIPGRRLLRALLERRKARQARRAAASAKRRALRAERRLERLGHRPRDGPG